MDTLIAQLDQKYNEYRKNLSGEYIDSDEDVFYSAYEYLCITEKQLKIKEIIEKDKQYVERKKQEIIKKNESLDTQKELIEKIENNSLSFCYGELFKDVYLPMNKYKNSVSILSPKDVLGDTVLFREKFFKTLTGFVKKVAQFFNIDFGKDVDMRLVINNIIYGFKRQKKYSIYMERMHRLLIPHLLELHTQKQEVKNTKIDLVIDSKKGIYKKGNDELAYGVGKNSKRFKIVRHLLTKDSCYISELADITHQTNHVTMKSISEIKRLFREKTLLTDDLICHNDTIGYFFNKDKFEPHILE